MLVSDAVKPGMIDNFLGTILRAEALTVVLLKQLGHDVSPFIRVAKRVALGREFRVLR